QAAAKSTGLSASSDGTHVAAAVGVDVDDITNNATVGQDAVITGDGITIEAVNTGGKTNQLIVWGLAGAGGSSEDNGGASVAAGKVEVSAKSSIKEADPIVVPIIGALPKFSSVALAAAASSGGAAVSGSIIVDVFLITTSAQINSGTKINQFTGAGGGGSQTLKVEATDDTSFTNIAGGLNFSTDGAGVGIGIVVDVTEKHV